MLKAARKGFTLVEIMVVIGILGILLAVMVRGMSSAPKKAERQKCEELVKNAADALTMLYNKFGYWPEVLVQKQNSESGLDEIAGYVLAANGCMSLQYDSDSERLTGLNRLGIVSPWAESVIKSKGTSASLSSPVPSGGSVSDHRLRFALDLDGDNIIDNVNVGGETVNIRGTAAVWCCGMDGKIEPYSSGQRGDDVYSWDRGKTQNVK